MADALHAMVLGRGPCKDLLRAEAAKTGAVRPGVAILVLR